MSLLRWSDRYRVGIEAVDHEHRELIELINRLHDTFMQDRRHATAEGLFGDPEMMGRRLKAALRALLG